MRRHTHTRAFTLIELLIVVSVIGLATMIVLPAVGELFAGQAYVQAHNLIDVKLRSARGLAIRDRRYTGVHVQRHYRTGEFWVAIVQETIDDPNPDADDQPDVVPWGARELTESLPSDGLVADVSHGRLPMRLAPGTRPSRLPTGIGVGFVASRLESVGNLYDAVDRYVPREPQERADLWEATPFTTFTVLFDPDGKLVTDYKNEPRLYFVAEGSDGDYYCDPMFSVADHDNDDPRKIWDLPADMTKVGLPSRHVLPIAMCLFDVEAYDVLDVGGNPRDEDGSLERYLNVNARFLPVAPYLGGLIDTPSQ